MIYVPTQNGQRLCLPSSTFAPAFKHVSDITKAKNCAVILQGEGGIITPRTTLPPLPVIHPLQLRQGLYHFEIKNHKYGSKRPAEGKALTATPGHTKKFFRTKKPGTNRRPLRKATDKTTSNITTNTTDSLRRIPSKIPPIPRHRGYRTENITYTIPFPDHLPPIPTNFRQRYDSAHTLHIRLNHVAPTVLQHMAKTETQLGLPAALTRPPPPAHFQGCIEGHYQRAPHRWHTSRPPPGHTVVTDIAGPLPRTPDGHQYFLKITDLRSRLYLVYILKNRAVVEEYLTEAAATLEKHFGNIFSRFPCDNAQEFLSKVLLRLFGSKATTVDPTPSHTPQENSIADRANKTLMNCVRSTLNTARLPFQMYWAYCLLDTVQKTNAMYHRGIADIPLRVFQ